MSAEEVAKAFVQHFYNAFDTNVDSLSGLYVSLDVAYEMKSHSQVWSFPRHTSGFDGRQSIKHVHICFVTRFQLRITHDKVNWTDIILPFWLWINHSVLIIYFCMSHRRLLLFSFMFHKLIQPLTKATVINADIWRKPSFGIRSYYWEAQGMRRLLNNSG